MAIEAPQAIADFEQYFGFPPSIGARAPGRVNIIGEHTDYNDGFVLPMGIDRETLVLARPRQDAQLHAYAATLGDSAAVDLRLRARQPAHPWVDYLIGVIAEVEQLGYAVPGLDLRVEGDVPIGSGLSSSAALEMAMLQLLESLLKFSLSPAQAASLGQRVENNYLGLKSGIMDQFICRAAQAGHALFVDCRSLAFDPIPLAFDRAVFIIADTGLSRGLTASSYNARVTECEQAVAVLQDATGRKGTHLRDYTATELAQAQSLMPTASFRRARHVISENDRTLKARTALQSGDAEALGALMNASDTSLRMDYEVTCPELDTMTAMGRSLRGCFGSRMTGAGFGGCTIHLVNEREADVFEDALTAEYEHNTGHTAACFRSMAAPGAAPVVLS